MNLTSRKKTLSWKTFLVLPFFLIMGENVSGEIVEEIYYVVDNALITKLDFEEELELLKKNPENTSTFNDITVMSNLIIDQLIEKKLVENNLAVKDSDITNYINVIVEKNNIGSVEDFISLLGSTQNLSYDEYKAIIKRKLNYQYYITRLVSTPPVNNREIEEYYQQNRDSEFKIKDPILNLSTLTLIVKNNAGFSEKLEVQNRMLQIKKEIDEQSLTFEEAVKKYSEDETTKAVDGFLGWIDPIQLGVGAENLKILRTMQKGEISTLMRDSRGISLYKVNDIISEGYIPYDLAIQDLKSKIFKEKQQKAFLMSLRDLVQSSVLIAKNPRFKVDFHFSE